jgi:hypothetical protein
VDPGARVCPFCGELPGAGVFCAVCGRNLGGVQRLPTRGAWDDERAAKPDPDPLSPSAGAVDSVAGFLAAMHGAGDPGTVKMPRAEPGFLGRTQHVHGWVVRAVDGGRDDPPGRTVPGLLLTVDGHLHRLDRVTRGLRYSEATYMDVVGPEVVERVDAARLASELAAVLRVNRLHDTAP